MIYDLFYRHCGNTWTDEATEVTLDSKEYSDCPCCGKSVKHYLVSGFKVKK